MALGAMEELGEMDWAIWRRASMEVRITLRSGWTTRRSCTTSDSLARPSTLPAPRVTPHALPPPNDPFISNTNSNKMASSPLSMKTSTMVCPEGLTSIHTRSAHASWRRRSPRSLLSGAARRKCRLFSVNLENGSSRIRS